MSRVAFGVFVLELVYALILIAYLNLKPAVPLLNPRQYDMALEHLERLMFGGVLPTEYLILHSTYFAVLCWDIIYNLFSPFMFVSLAIAFYYEGFFGGCCLVLAYTTGLLICILIALAYPTFGLLFTHPDWFKEFSALPSNQFAAFLKGTVDEYARVPGTVYACAGIAAMPSYHVFACVCGIAYWRYLPAAFQFFGIALVLLIWVSTVVLGWHYLLDGLAGIILAIIVMATVTKIKRLPVTT
jgi:membrane-associated phospholipid phosphatase